MQAMLLRLSHSPARFREILDGLEVAGRTFLCQR
jgi:hypothetical protein